jgi:chromodomain-helicase-DNA-binding protein 1
MLDEIRVSTRGGKIPNYYDDVEDFENFEEETHPGYYYADPNTQFQQEDEIEQVLTHSRDEGRENDNEDNFYDNIVRPLENLDMLTITSQFVFQRFHIKWKNFSHLHNTDETYEFLKRFKGLKRVDNYIKADKVYQARLATPDLTREDYETLLLDKEREKEEFEMFKTVERVIAQREANDGQIEYFCKWNGLNYEHCTWETHDTIRPIAKTQIESYQKKEAEGKFPFRSISYPKDKRPQFKKINSDPEYIQETGGELKDFQLTGLNWLAYLWSKGLVFRDSTKAIMVLTSLSQARMASLQMKWV